MLWRFHVHHITNSGTSHNIKWKHSRVFQKWWFGYSVLSFLWWGQFCLSHEGAEPRAMWVCLSWYSTPPYPMAKGRIKEFSLLRSGCMAHGQEGKGDEGEWLVVFILVGALNQGIPFLNHKLSHKLFKNKIRYG